METIFKSALTILIITLSIKISSSSSTKFLQTSCKPTSYPNVCMQSLSAYSSIVRRSPRHLADVALSLSVRRVHETSTYASKLSSRNTEVHNSMQKVNYAIKDCMATMADSEERLRRSIHQLRKLGRANMPSFGLRLSNVLTWASAALTDQNMCVLSLTEGAVGGDVHEILKKKVVEVSKITSNALSLVNRLGSRN